MRSAFCFSPFCYHQDDGFSHRHADDTYPAEAAEQMVKMVEGGYAEMVIGDRLSSTYKEENKRPLHNFGNTLVRNSINRLFHTDIQDIMTGYRAFSYEFIKTFPVLSSGFEIETEMTIHAIDRKMQLESIPVAYRDRPEGSESKLNTLSDGVKVLRTIIKLYRSYMPLRFFGIIAAVLALLSVLFFIPVWMDYLRTGMVERFPTLIVCGIVMVMALLMFIAGVVLSTLRQKDRRDFEFKLVIAEWIKKRS